MTGGLFAFSAKLQNDDICFLNSSSASARIRFASIAFAKSLTIAEASKILAKIEFLTS